MPSHPEGDPIVQPGFAPTRESPGAEERGTASHEHVGDQLLARRITLEGCTRCPGESALEPLPPHALVVRGEARLQGFENLRGDEGYRLVVVNEGSENTDEPASKEAGSSRSRSIVCEVSR